MAHKQLRTPQHQRLSPCSGRAVPSGSWIVLHDLVYGSITDNAYRGERVPLPTLVGDALARQLHVIQPRSFTIVSITSFTTITLPESRPTQAPLPATPNSTPVVDSSFTFVSDSIIVATAQGSSTSTFSVNSAEPFTIITQSGSSSVFSPSTTLRPTSSPSVNSTPSPGAATSRGLSPGAIAGIAVVVGVGASLGTALTFYICMKKRRARSYGNRINIVGAPLFFKS